MATDAPGKGGGDARVREVDLGERDRGGRLVALRLPLLDVRLGGGVLFDHAQLALVFGLRIQQLRLLRGEFRRVGLRLDDKQQMRLP